MTKTWAAAAVAGVGLAVFATSAAAVPRPVLPPDGGKVRSSFPSFRWTMPLTEQAQAIYVADSPVITADGSFPVENVVVARTLAADDERWTPSRPLWAGSYWWIVESSDRDTAVMRYSEPWGFTIPISLDVRQIVGPRSRVVTVRWRGNVERAAITLRMSSRGRLVWTATKIGVAVAPGRIVSTRFLVPLRFAAVVEGATFTVGISARLAARR